MKNQSFPRRVRFAANGFVQALHTESSFRFHLAATVGILVALAWLRPAPAWWAIIALTVSLVIAAELVNTALEVLADRLHPEQHSDIRIAKDCAAAAVLVSSIGALAVAAALLYDQFT